MNQRDGFTGGFIAGTIVGGVVGGVIGALLASGKATDLAIEAEARRNNNLSEGNNSKRQRRFRSANSEQSIEIARRSLEDKIAQLNETIDEVSDGVAFQPELTLCELFWSISYLLPIPIKLILATLISNLYCYCHLAGKLPLHEFNRFAFYYTKYFYPNLCGVADYSDFIDLVSQY